MRQCTTCGRTYDPGTNMCEFDGTPLFEVGAALESASRNRAAAGTPSLRDTDQHSPPVALTTPTSSSPTKTDAKPVTTDDESLRPTVRKSVDTSNEESESEPPSVSSLVSSQDVPPPGDKLYRVDTAEVPLHPLLRKTGPILTEEIDVSESDELQRAAMAAEAYRFDDSVPFSDSSSENDAVPFSDAIPFDDDIVPFEDDDGVESLNEPLDKLQERLIEINDNASSTTDLMPTTEASTKGSSTNLIFVGGAIVSILATIGVVIYVLVFHQ